MSTVNVRYIVNDVESATDFYCDQLGFEREMTPGTGFAMLSRGDLRLLLNKPGVGGAGQPMPDGTVPQPGGWNRFQLEVEDLETTVDALERSGVPCRNNITTGRGGKQILVEDPAGNPVELFQPR